MKHVINVFLFSLLVLSLNSCKKDEANFRKSNSKPEAAILLLMLLSLQDRISRSAFTPKRLKKQMCWRNSISLHPWMAEQPLLWKTSH